MSGSWTIDKAIKSRWVEKNLDSTFRAYWATPTETRFPVFNDGEARASTPMPYCVYEKGTGIKTGESTAVIGEGNRKIEYWTQPIQFRIHATKHQNRTGKEVAKEMAKAVIAAFEDEAGALDLDEDDCHIETVVGPDFHTREDDDVWVWVLQFDVNFERRRQLRGVA